MSADFGSSVRARANAACASSSAASRSPPSAKRAAASARQHKANADAASDEATKATLDLAQQQFGLGSISLVALLNAEQARQQAEINLIQARANRYADTVALFQALGGGWWNRPKGSSL